MQSSQIFCLVIAAFLSAQVVLWSSPFVHNTIKNSGILADGMFKFNTTGEAALQTAYQDIFSGVIMPTSICMIFISILAAFGSAGLRDSFIAAWGLGHGVLLAFVMITWPGFSHVQSAVRFALVGTAFWLSYQRGVNFLALLTPAKKQNPYLKVAIWFRLGFGFFWAAILLFNMDGYISSIGNPTVEAALREASAYRGGQTAGVFLAFVCFVALVAFNHGSKREQSVAAGISIWYILHTMEVQSRNSVIPINIPAIVYGLFQLVLLVLGLASNEKVDLWQRSGGLLNPKNTLGFSLILSFASQISRHPALVTDAGRNWYLTSPATYMAHDMFASLVTFRASGFVVLFIVWLLGNAQSVRAALLSVGFYNLAILGFMMTQSPAVGFIQERLRTAYAVLLLEAVLALVSLYQNVHGDIIGWLRQEFRWSYSPARGGLYSACIYNLLAGAALLVGSFPGNDFIPRLLADSPVTAFFVKDMGLVAVLLGLQLYLVARVANEEVLTATTWGLAAHLITFNLSNFYDYRNGPWNVSVPVSAWVTFGVQLAAVLSPYFLAQFRKVSN